MYVAETQKNFMTGNFEHVTITLMKHKTITPQEYL